MNTQTENVFETLGNILRPEPTKAITPNKYSKYCPNVFVMETENNYERGEETTIETKHGKEHEVIVFNLVATKGDKKYYSIVRADGYNVQERAKAKAARLMSWAASAENKSNQYYEASQEGKDFLVLGEPIKVGHHSEKRHRALIQRNWDRMGKCVEYSDKAAQHESKAEYWAKKANDINLSMPESLEYYEHLLEQAKERQQTLKDSPEKREHAYSLTYATKAVKEAQSNLNTAVKLWGEESAIQQIKDAENEKLNAKAAKLEKANNKIKQFGGFFAFNNDQLRSGIEAAKANGFLLEGEKIMHFGQGLYIPSKFKEAYYNSL